LRVADASVDLLVERVAQCDGSVVGLTDVNIGGQLDVVREFSPYIPTDAPNVQVRARPTPRAWADQAPVVRSRQRRVGLRLVQLGRTGLGSGAIWPLRIMTTP
jgi:hypothetical protein